jgi:hypothetical protein
MVRLICLPCLCEYFSSYSENTTVKGRYHMAEYTVTWKIDVEAINDVEAERKARAFMCHTKMRYAGVMLRDPAAPALPRVREVPEKETKGKSLILPTVGVINGTPRADLLLRYGLAYWASDKTVNHLRTCEPRSVDYLVQGAAVIDGAKRQHLSRLTRIESVRLELAGMWMGLNQMDPLVK